MVKSVGKWWVASDDPVVEDLKQELDDLYQELDEQEKEIDELKRVVDDQQKLISNLKGELSRDRKFFDNHLNRFSDMLKLLRELGKTVDRLYLRMSKSKEISPVADQPTDCEGEATDQITGESTSPEAEPVAEAESGSK